MHREYYSQISRADTFICTLIPAPSKSTITKKEERDELSRHRPEGTTLSPWWSRNELKYETLMRPREPVKRRA